MDLAKQLVSSLQNVLKTCGSVRISFSRRTQEKVGLLLLGHLTVRFNFFTSHVHLICELLLQVSDIIMKEFRTHPKVYIWDGEGIFTNEIGDIS